LQFIRSLLGEVVYAGSTVLHFESDLKALEPIQGQLAMAEAVL
jgi:hypothetical protein